MKKVLIATALTALILGCFSTGIHRSVGKQEMKEVQEYVESGGDINAVDRHGFTPLITACYFGSESVANYLCRKGADLNAQDNEGKTALIHATYFGFGQIVSALLNNRADPNLKDKYGYNALWYSEKSNRDKITAMLKSYGAKPPF